MSRWMHLTEVPDEVRTTMSTTFLIWEKADLTIESVIDQMIKTPEITDSACRALRSAANKTRVPALCQVLNASHPELSKRQVFMAVGLFLGLHQKHVQDLVYHFNRKPYGPTAR